MIDYETEVRIRDCKECVYFIEGNKCRAFDVIPFDYFLNAKRHKKPNKNQYGNYTFKSDKPTPKMRIYTAE